MPRLPLRPKMDKTLDRCLIGLINWAKCVRVPGDAPPAKLKAASSGVAGGERVRTATRPDRDRRHACPASEPETSRPTGRRR